jgi:hypothetical protein
LFINSIFVLAVVLAAQDTSATVNGEIDGPAADVQLTLQTTPRTIFSVRTDGNGKFKSPGIYTLTMAQLGFRTLTLKSIRLASEEQKILPRLRLPVDPSDGAGPPVVDHLKPATDERVGNLSGRVMQDESRAIARATVKLLCDEKVCGETKTDTNGEFFFFSLSPREDYMIRVTHPGYCPWHRNDYEVQAGYDATYWPMIMKFRSQAKRPLISCE